MLPLLLAGAALQTYGTLKSASAERRSADDRATALRAQAARRLAKGKLESESLLTQGKMSQTSYAAQRLSSGSDRETLAQDTSLSEISNRAQYEANLAIENAQYDAKSMEADATQTSQYGRDQQEAAGISTFGSILSQAYGYSSRNIASKSGNK